MAREAGILRRPELGRLAAGDDVALVVLAELLRDALGADVVRVDERDQTRRTQLLDRPVARGRRRLGRVAGSPVAAREGPADLGLERALELGAEAVLPRAGIPDEEAGPTEHSAVLAPLDREQAAPVASPVAEHEFDDLACLVERPRDAAQVPDDLGVAERLGQTVDVARLGQAQAEAFGLDHVDQSCVLFPLAVTTSRSKRSPIFFATRWDRVFA